MLVDLNKPHDVDDPDDDILFADQRNRRDPNRHFDYLDYSSSGSSSSGIFTKIQRYFEPNGPPASIEQRSDIDFFNVDDDDILEGSGASLGPRTYQIKRLERKLNKAILWFACGLVLVFAFLFFKKDSLAAYGYLPMLKIVLSNGTCHFHPTTLMISLDGFHPHYISQEVTPALHKMLVHDYGAPYMVPSFPSSTFPNHWTLVTGLYPADHGIVGNTFYDPKLQKQFVNTDPKYGLNPEFWQGGEPIWTTAAKQGVTSAIHMWPGSEVPTVGNNGPLYIDKYNGTKPLSRKTERIFGWLDIDNLAKRPELVLAYVPTIDQIGHKQGISGGKLVDSLRYVDDFVRLVQEQLAQRNLQNIVNLVVVSDHGMAPTSNDRLLFLDDVVTLDQIEHIDGWPLFGLRPKPEFSVEKIYGEIKGKLRTAKLDIRDNFRLYRIEDIPPEWQFGGNNSTHRFNYRLAPLWIVPNVGYSVTTRLQFKKNNNEYRPKGVHGYNNTHLLMRAIFLADGPYFKKTLAKTKKVLPFTNVNVYNIVCDTLQLRPSPNNGSSAGKHFSISSANRLPENWSDDLMYPDLPYEVDHIVSPNATYDELWRPSVKKVLVGSVDEKEQGDVISSLKSYESVMPNPEPLTMPKPSDFSNPVSAGSLSASQSDSSSISSTHSEEKPGFFGHFLGHVGGFLDAIDTAMKDAVEYADSWLNGDS